MLLDKIISFYRGHVTIIRRGFTLVELIVGVAIMTIILGITFSGGPQAITRAALSDNAYQVELMIREAQLQGSAINSLGGLYGGAGVFFDRATSTEVLKFKDLVDDTSTNSIKIGNGLYDASPVDEKEQPSFMFTRRNRIGHLCVATSTSPIMCNDDYTPHITTLTISFIRPKQTAYIYINGTKTGETYTFACVGMYPQGASSTQFVKSILIYGSGMITKSDSRCG